MVALQDRGLFTAVEWADALGAEIRRAQDLGDADTGETYYEHWLATLERLLEDKALATPSQLARYRHAWHHAAARTPHGSPIELTMRDFDAHGVDD